VRLRDGTEYRLGYNTDSEQIVATNSYTVPATPGESNYAGNTNGRVAFQWRVDKVTDVHGNVIEFSYQEETTGDPTVRDRASYLSQVRYNYLTSGWGTRITFIRAARSSDGVGDAVDPNYQYYYFYQNDFLQRIKVENWDNGQYNTVREYLLTYDARTVPPGEHNNHTRRLVSIREYGTDGYGGDSLPTTTFGYTVYQNKDWCSTCPEWELWNRESFRYERLTSINNGYGGVISFAYETPDGGWWQAWNYRVSQKTVSDGQSGGSKVTYAYTPAVDQRCYVDPMNSEAFGCYFFSPMSTTGGSLVGYGSVTETLKTLADTAIAVTAHKFKLDTLASPNRSKGREFETCHLNGTGTEIQQVISTTWVVSSTTAMTDTYTYFVYAQWVKEFTREGDGLPSTPQKKTYYAYEPERGGQYGNLTYVLEYQGDAAYRRTRTHFYPNTIAWIVDRPAVITACNASDVPQTITRLYYDGAANYTAPPQRGDVTKKEQTVSVGASPVWITTQTITYKDSSYYYLPYIVADGNGNHTTTTYDSTWKMYPITVTNALGQAATYEYNYILGKVTKVTGPNGSTTATSYEYDEFGRLTKIIRPGDTSTYPTIQYAYCDTCSPFRIIATQRLVAAGSDIPILRFYNGIGQLIQENKGTTDRSQMTIANTVYNAQGLVEKAYVPYLATYSTAYQTPDTNQPKTT
ncbi:MAG: RHS repeat domain-containing protein, partial [Anaerolineae bacterium]